MSLGIVIARKVGSLFSNKTSTCQIGPVSLGRLSRSCLVNLLKEKKMSRIIHPTDLNVCRCDFEVIFSA